MTEHKLPEEISSVLNQVRLKQPSETMLSHFSGDVDKKIEHALKAQRGIRLPILLSCGILLVLCLGLYWMYAMQTRPVVKAPVVKQVSDFQPKRAVEKTASLERELEALEILDPDFDNELIELAGDEYFLEEYSGFDEAEFSAIGMQNSLMK